MREICAGVSRDGDAAAIEFFGAGGCVNMNPWADIGALRAFIFRQAFDPPGPK